MGFRAMVLWMKSIRLFFCSSSFHDTHTFRLMYAFYWYYLLFVFSFSLSYLFTFSTFIFFCGIY